MVKQIRKRKQRFISGGVTKPRAQRRVSLDIGRELQFTRAEANIRTGGFMGIENKFYDQKLIQGALTSPTDVTGGEHNPSATLSLNTILQGDGESNRDGRQISMNKISVMGNFKIAPQTAQTAMGEATICFACIVLDTQTNGALLNSEDVFINPGANAITAAQLFRNLQFTSRFKVLASVRVSFDTPNTGYTGGANFTQGGLTKTWEMHVPLKILTQFKDTQETIANIVDNGLNIVAFCSDTEMAPKISYSSRLRFTG